MSVWTLRAVWPVEDPDLGYQDMIRLAVDDLPQVAHRAGALIVGEPSWRVEESGEEFSAAGLALVCVVAAVPDHDRWPVVIADLASQGWSDGRIAEVLRCKPERIRGVRRRCGIPPGVPKGYTSRGQVREPKWPAT